MGDQFYLFWHSNYNDTQIVCDPGTLGGILSKPISVWGDYYIPEDVQLVAHEIDLAPTVEMDVDVVKTRIVTFTKWGGFSEVKTTYSRRFPHKVLQADAQVLVRCDCGGYY
jgi:hypothetical protein